MAVFVIQDADTGRQLTVRGDSPPTEGDIKEIFDSNPLPAQGSTNIYQKAYQQSGQVSPMEEGNTSLLSATASQGGPLGALIQKPIAAAGELGLAGIGDLLTGGGYDENGQRKPAFPNLGAYFKGNELPVDADTRAIAQSNPSLATASKVASGVVRSAPLIALGLPEGAAGRIAALGISAGMVKDYVQSYKTLNDELQKPDSEQNQDVINSARANLIQGAIFAPLLAGHALKVGGEPVTIPQETPAPQASELVQKAQEKIDLGQEPTPEQAQALKSAKQNNSREAFEDLAAKEGSPLPTTDTGTPQLQAGASPALQRPEAVSDGSASSPTTEPPPAITEPTPDEQIEQGGTSPDGLVGMGGAVPSEFERGQGSPTAMKYRLIDQERQQRGLEPLAKPDSVSDQTVMDKAIAAIDQNPEAPDDLVKELLNKPRSIDAHERMMLLLRKIDLRDAYEKSARASAQAYEDSQEFPERKAEMIQHNIETARLSDKLNDLEQASRLSGSEQGRGLRALRIMANEDYSLASLEMQRRASNGGKPITDDERAGLVKVADDYKKANESLQQHIKEKDERLLAAEVKSALDRLALEKAPSYHPKILKLAEKLVQGLETRADAARQRIREKALRFSSGVDPTLILDAAEIGAAFLGRKALSFAEWSSKMIGEFGEGVKPHLKDIYNKSNDLIDRIKTPEIVKRTAKGQTIEQQVKSVTERVKDKVLDGKKEDIAPQAQKLAKLFLEQGITDREKLIDAVHGALKEAIPEITRREAMDAISGYGDFRQLSKDEISTKLRGLKGEMQQLSKLQDMADGIPPSKTGVERRTPTDEERKLIKAVNEAKIKFQVPITDPATQLKSALDTKKTQLENSIKDLHDRIANEDYSKRPKRPLELDRRAQELQADRDRVVKKFKTEQRKYELSNRTPTEKLFDFISNARRFSVLSGVNVLGKLAAYSATKIPTMALTEGIGTAMSKLPFIRDISAKAPSEGALKVRDLAKSVARGLTQGFLDAYKTGTTGSSDLKSAFSPRLENSREWYNFFQTVHEVIKSPLRRSAFELSLSKRMEHAANNGADITDPMTQLSLAKDAYLDSDRALLLENNRLAAGIRSVFKQLEQVDKKTGRVPLHGKIAATAGRLELPILTVPLNYAKQALTSAFGLVSGSYKLGRAFHEGIDKLSPEEADQIMRHLKYGTIGGAMLLYGFYDGYKNGGNGTFGGYYQPGEKRKENQAGVGGLKIGSHKIPGLVLHNPVLAVGQLGHTIGAIAASKVSKKNPEQRGVTAGTVAGLMGLFNESPLGRQSTVISQISDPRSADYAIGEHLRGFVPQLVNEAALQSDTKNGKLTARKPTNYIQHVEMSIPGLRQTVPNK